MGLFDWLFGKPRLYCPRGHESIRGPGLLSRMFSITSPHEYLDMLSYGAKTGDGGQICKYGVYIEGGFDTITGVGDALLIDILGSNYALYYVKEDIFYDFPMKSLWLVNDRNKYMTKCVLFDALGLRVIVVKEAVLQRGSSGPLLYLAELHGKPWSRDLIRQAGIDLPE